MVKSKDSVLWSASNVAPLPGGRAERQVVIQFRCAVDQPIEIKEIGDSGVMEWRATIRLGKAHSAHVIC